MKHIADRLEIAQGNNNAEELIPEAIAMLRQQQERINQLEETQEYLYKTHDADKAEIERLSFDNKHYRDMAVDFLRRREPYGWHCFIGKGKEEQDFLSINNKGASMPDASWDKVIPLYTHPVKELTIHEDIVYGLAYKYGIEKVDVLDFARAILRKAQEK